MDCCIATVFLMLRSVTASTSSVSEEWPRCCCGGGGIVSLTRTRNERLDEEEEEEEQRQLKPSGRVTWLRLVPTDSLTLSYGTTTIREDGINTTTSYTLLMATTVAMIAIVH